MSITVQIVFSGLILLASDQGLFDKHAALVVEDEHHFPAIFLVKGTTTDACASIDGWTGCLIWDFELDPPWEVYFSGLTHQRSLRMIGRSTDESGAPVMIPLVPKDLRDINWLPQLSVLAGSPGLDDGCMYGDGRQCGGGLAARFLIPFGEIRNCHLAHRHREPQRVVVATYQPPVPGAMGAMGNAFLAEFEVPGESIELCRKRDVNGSTSQCITIHPSQENGKVIRLFLRNEAGDRCGGPVDQAVTRHGHFGHFYPLLRGNPTGPVPQLSQLFGDSPGAGECEAELSGGDDVSDQFLSELRQKLDKGPLTSFRGRSRLFSTLVFHCQRVHPHSASQCDTSTYP